jgi:hypothetical protein
MHARQSPNQSIANYLTARRGFWVTLVAAGIATTAASPGLATAPIDAPSGITTAHSSLIAHWVGQLPQSVNPSREALALRCFETIQHSDVIGVAHALVIHASAARVTSILDDYDHYKDLFEDTVYVHTSPIPNGLRESWEQKAPAIFLPNTRFVVNTFIHDELPKRKIWHSRLVSSNQLLGNDVFVAVYPLDKDRSYYWEVDFINAKWGILSSIAMSSIWSGGISATAVSDLAIKFRAENPAWSYALVRDFAKKRVDTRLVDQCVNHRVALDLTREPTLREL